MTNKSFIFNFESSDNAIKILSICIELHWFWAFDVWTHRDARLYKLKPHVNSSISVRDFILCISFAFGECLHFMCVEREKKKITKMNLIFFWPSINGIVRFSCISSQNMLQIWIFHVFSGFLSNLLNIFECKKNGLVKIQSNHVFEVRHTDIQCVFKLHQEIKCFFIQNKKIWLFFFSS